jgi:zinc transport system substrate-binding protein
MRSRGQGSGVREKTNIEYRTRNDECRSAQKLKNKLRQSSIVNRHSIFVVRNGIIAILVLILSSFSIADDNPSGKLTIYTVNYPLKYFAERIAGEHATVVFPAPAKVDPAYWMPDKKTIMDYQKADLILLNGAHYAKWTEKVSLPRSKMVNTSRKFKDKYIKTKEAVTHSHGPGGKHAHEDVAFTIWLDLDLATQQAKAIEKALSRKRPELKSSFERKYTALEKDLMAIDREIKETVSNSQNQPLIASHPVYDYLSRRYGLNMKSIHWEPDEIPNGIQWAELKRILKDHKAQWMIWEAEPIKKSLEILESTGVNSIVFDPCGNVPEKGDFLSVMKQNVEYLGLAFR